MTVFQIIRKYVEAEKRAGYVGDWEKVSKMSAQVRRACYLYNYTRNPY